MALYMNLRLMVQDGSVYLSTDMELCVDKFLTCLPSVELFYELPFSPNTIRRKRGICKCDSLIVRQLFLRLPIICSSKEDEKGTVKL